jgi:thiosulfate/3-mercaptopyruvate sulfurtransferase
LSITVLVSVLTLSPTRAEESSPPHATMLTPTDLRTRLDDEAWRILDVRKSSAYEAGHIPGALRVDTDAWSARSLKDGGLQDAAYWSREIGRPGIDDATPVVVYGDNVATAARIWWLLAYAGLSEAALLDGGWQAWRRRGFPVAIQSQDAAATEFRCRLRVQWLIGADQLRRDLKSSMVQIVDSRSAGEYSGRRIFGSRGGRIPGASHLDWLDLLDEQGCFRKTDQIERLLRSKGISKE